MRLLHLSDLHLRSTLLGTSNWPDRLSRSVPHLLQRASATIAELALDAVVITGDLVDVPKPLLRGEVSDPQERGTMEAAARSDYLLIRDWLDDLRLPYMAVPGNHDLYPLFEQVFGNERERVVDGIRLIAFHDREHADNVPHRTDADRSLFHRVLDEADTRYQIHLQHFVTRPALDKEYPYNYADFDEIGVTLERSRKVVAVLSGHYHPGCWLSHESGVSYSIVPGFCIAPHPFRVVEIGASGSVSYRDLVVGPSS